MTEESTKPPKVFISYAWENDTKIWVRELATRLRFNGVHAILDQWDVALGDSLPEFMESSVSASDFVLVVCTPAYKSKSDSSDPSGVGYEKGVITGELFVKRNQRKFIPILRKGKWLESAPSWVLGKNYIDLRSSPLNEDNYQELLRTLYGKREPPPPLGTPPDFSGKDGSKTKLKPGVSRKSIISKDTIAKFTSNLKTNVAKLMPSFRLAGILVIISVLLLTGSLAIPKIIALIPTAQTREIPPANTSIAFTKTPAPPTKTTRPNATPTLMAMPLPTEITDAKGVSMVLVPAGEFTMGVDSGRNTGLTHRVYLDSFYMDVYEVTNALYQECVLFGDCTLPQKDRSFTRSSYYDNIDYRNYPVIYVDWNQAQAYCEWRGGSLPTEAQWEKAARGTDGRSYPWGNQFDGNYINFCDKNCSFYWREENSNDGYVDTSPVGSYEDGKSPYGVHDLAGNVWEWVYDWYDGSYYENSPSSNPLGPDTGSYHVVRGGAWSSRDDETSSVVRYTNQDNQYIYYSLNVGNFIGFRCAANP